ncbi:bifunctional 2-polyprenyl-6-hydroxyphenol methylase/3-demethylubiquinol 3-O-methyltransferase UbiG [Marichromatium gracile]|uniref:bifunctional 2-polyprenyl-6-hydroxyphenol methylase/3-demethylubiquinol 3-O-methyltransferase UbiG n=1 Tax=Marichromatium gracile TaxID=1048 RepID=UPI001F47EBC7|nr:bifunctional 2-polyprenyl-6-hydroxyphenol methylase/3-demethylubiquinol 3-O-methyltransferase UbiG [Marichromatium gracile]MCF1183963.1 bifunctional 2-polyprenyl-6-hydroxyphenol methylase/3-demethylubiquinol 3-O-methyltransferase UbiG [Marichromatium gracile]
MPTAHLTAPSVDPEEVAYYERLAHRWWDAEGPFWPLHRLNAFRVGYLRERLATVFGCDPQDDRLFAGLRVLDIGCGGGILSESMVALGAEVTGIDITEKTLRVARMHAEEGGLAIDYRLASAAEMREAGATFDVVLNMEVLEHVERLPDFLADSAELVRPGGVMQVSTINRTPAAWLMAIIGAEYVLRWLPRGTHRYRKLVRPDDVRGGLGEGFDLLHQTGVRVNPFTRAFSFTGWMGVNYMMLFQRG